MKDLSGRKEIMTQLQESVDHWNMLAKIEEDEAEDLKARGLFIGCQLARAETYRRTAKSIELEIQTGKLHCTACLGPHDNQDCPKRPWPSVVTKARALDTTTRLIHVVDKVPHPGSAKGVGRLRCDTYFIWDSAPPWHCEKFLAAGKVVASRRSNEATPTCLQCITKDLRGGA